MIVMGKRGKRDRGDQRTWQEDISERERERLTAMQERENLLMAEIQRYPFSLHFPTTTTDLTSVVSHADCSTTSTK
jgi:hypothetical protein